MSWSWNKYRENHQQVPPPVAEPVPTEPATPPPAPETEPGDYPFELEPDEE